MKGSRKLAENLAHCFTSTDSFTDLDLKAIKWNAMYAPYNCYVTKNYSVLEKIHSYGALALCTTKE